MATASMYRKKSREVWFLWYASGQMYRQTHRHAHCNTSHAYRGRSNNATTHQVMRTCFTTLVTLSYGHIVRLHNATTCNKTNNRQLSQLTQTTINNATLNHIYIWGHKNASRQSTSVNLTVCCDFRRMLWIFTIQLSQRCLLFFTCCTKLSISTS